MHSECAVFEREFAQWQDRAHAILFNSGGSANLALMQSLMNLGRLERCDQVAFSALTWSTNVMPILQMGLQPVPVDCSPTTLNVMSECLEAVLRVRAPKALFITNALGCTGNLGAIRDICAERDIILLEDNCESLGSALREGRAGNFGLASTFSFFVAHHMSTIEGGMVATNDEELAEMLRIVRANGWDRNLTAAQQLRLRRENGVTSELEAKYTFYDLGFNLRPTEITGFLGRWQLQRVDAAIAARQTNHALLEAVLRENPDLIPVDRSHMTVFSPFAFVVLCRTPELRERYFAQFAGAGVELRLLIAGNILLQPFYRKYVNDHKELPGVQALHDCGFYFGNYPELSEMDLEILSSCLAQYGGD
jgi:CDP-6-deoxy-D-xylo-4-hexulose-3-dehydrase